VALEPFASSRPRPLRSAARPRLPLSKALAEANRAGFRIKSTPNAGTLVEITFPRRVWWRSRQCSPQSVRRNRCPRLAHLRSTLRSSQKQNT